MFGSSEKNAFDYGSQLASEGLLVPVHCHLDELLRHAGIEQVHIREASVPARASVEGDGAQVVLSPHAFVIVKPGGDVLELLPLFLQAVGVAGGIVGQYGLLAESNALTLVVRLGHRRVDVPSGKAAGIGIFIVNPDVQPQFLPLFHAVFPKAEPLVREILRYQPRTRVHKGTAKACLLQLAQHAVDVGLGHIRIPYPQRNRTEVLGGICKLFLQLFQAVHPFLLAGTGSGGGSQQKDARQQPTAYQ